MHNKGQVKSTESRRPFTLIGYEEYSDRNKARYIEFQLKNSAWQRKKFMAKLKKIYNEKHKNKIE